MFCPNCGTEVKMGVFCPSCGTKVNNTQATSASATTAPTTEKESTPALQVATPTTNATPKSSKKAGIIALIIGIPVVLFLLLIGIIVFSVSRTHTLKLDKYVTVEFEGYDGLGKATATFDWEAFAKDYEGKLKPRRSAIRAYVQDYYLGFPVSESEIEYMIDYYSTTEGAIEAMRGEIEGSLDTSSGLSNGDTVTYHWDCDKEEVAKYYKVKLKYEDLSFTVAGLDQVGTFNPFSDVSVEYSGIAPNGEAYVRNNNSGDEYYYLKYSVDKTNNLSNGDQIKVTVSVNGSEESYVERYGKLPSPTEQTYTVEGLMSYITSSADIPEELMTQMQSQAEDHINSYIAKDWDEEVSLKELTYLGNYYLQNKGNGSPKNKCYLVYKITAEMSMETVDNGTVVETADSYYYVGFENLMTEADGTGAVDITDFDAPSWDSFEYATENIKSDGWWTEYYSYYYKGFETLDILYNEVVTKNLEYYSHEDNVTE